MKENFKNNIKSFFKSFINTKSLFDRRKNSFLMPIIAIILIVSLISLPTYLSSKKVTTEDIKYSFPMLEDAVGKLLKSSIDCSVTDGKLNCDESSKELYIDEEYTITTESGSKTYKYKIIINPKVSVEDVGETAKPTDNLVVLLTNYIRFRYVDRSLTTNTYTKKEIIGTYSLLEGYNFKDVAEKVNASDEVLAQETDNFIINTYKSTVGLSYVSTIINSVVSTLILLLFSAFVIKLPFWFKRKKGFKLRECIKISLTASYPCIVIASLAYVLNSFDFYMVFGFAFVIRILYIYFAYIFSKNKNIYDTLYKETREERFAR